MVDDDGFLFGDYIEVDMSKVKGTKFNKTFYKKKEKVDTSHNPLFKKQISITKAKNQNRSLLINKDIIKKTTLPS